MHGVDTSSVSLRREFGAYLSKVREAHGGKSHRDDFHFVATQLFPQYGKADEDLGGFMSRASRLLQKKRRHRDETPIPHRGRMKKVAQAASTAQPTPAEVEQREIVLDLEQGHPEPTQDIRPKPVDPRGLPAWKEVDGEILPPDGTEDGTE